MAFSTSQIESLEIWLIKHKKTKTKLAKEFGISRTSLYRLLSGQLKGTLRESKTWNAKRKLLEITGG